MESIKRYFDFEGRKTNFKTEIVAGVIVFLAMFYIVMVQASFFGGQPTANGNIVNAGSIAIITALGAGICSIFMGATTKHPIAQAAGMGVNAFIAFTLINFGAGMSFDAAIAAVMVSGILFLLISLTPLQARIINAIPDGMKYAIAAGVGLFIMFVALENTGIIVDEPSTLVTLGNFMNPIVLLAVIGIFIAVILWLLKIEGSTMIAMVSTLVIGLIFFGIASATSWGGANGEGLPGYGYDFSTLGETYKNSFIGIKDIIGAPFIGITKVDETWANPTWYLAIFILLLNDMLDSTGTIFGVNSGMTDFEDKDGEVFRKIMIVDATSTVIGSFIGSTNTTSYAESTAGVAYGARTGLAPIVTGILFILSIPFIPFFVPLVTDAVTAGAIVLVGIMMGALVTKIEFEDKVMATSAIFTIMFTILSFSIGIGIIMGLLSYAILMLATGRFKEVDWILYAATPIFILFLIAPYLI